MEQFLTKKVGLYESMTSKAPDVLSVQSVLSMIDDFPSSSLLEARAAGKGSELYEQEKKTAKFITWNTIYPPNTPKELGSGYLTGLCYVDIDSKVGPDKLAEIRQLPYVLATWISRGGVGLGLLCAIDIESKDYDSFPLIYAQISSDFAEIDIICDPACSNHNRGNFLSVDPDIWIRPASEAVTPVKAPVMPTSQPEHARGGYITEYNQSRAALVECESLLVAAGWKKSGRQSWTRPGKAKGTSGVLSDMGKWANSFHNFSENAGIPAGHYSFFDLLLALKFEGDIEAAKAHIRPAAKPKQATTSNGGRPPVMDNNAELIDQILDTLPSNETLRSLTFPEAAMPQWLRDYAKTYNEKSRAAKEYIYPTMLAVMGAASGNKLAIKIQDEWMEKPALWLTCVGLPGDGKSHPVNLLVRPITELQTELNNRFLEEKSKYELAKNMAETLTKTEREMLVAGGNDAKEPIERAIYATTGTIEAIFKYMARNNNDLVIHADEMTGFFNQLGAYKNGKGSDIESILTIWSGGRIERILATQDKTSIENTFMPLIGTSQYDKIGDVMHKMGMANGLFERMLFTEAPEMEYTAKDFSNEQASKMAWVYDWSAMIKALRNSYDNRTDVQVLTIPRSEQNVKILSDWSKELARQNNLHKANNEIGKLQINSKIDIYFFRIAAILWMFDSYDALMSGASFYNPEITPDQLSRAAEIANYFRLSAYSMLARFSKESTPHEMSARELQAYQRKIALMAYNSPALPEELKKNGYASIIAEVVNAKIGKVGVVSAAAVRGWKNRGWK